MQVEQVQALGEERVEVVAGVLDATSADGRGERHLALLACHAEMTEQSREVRVVAFVEHDEARVHRRAFRHLEGMGVAAGVGVLLVDGDIGMTPEQPTPKALRYLLPTTAIFMVPSLRKVPKPL